jgi:hypothetical protein
MPTDEPEKTDRPLMSDAILSPTEARLPVCGKAKRLQLFDRLGFCQAVAGFLHRRKITADKMFGEFTFLVPNFDTQRAGSAIRDLLSGGQQGFAAGAAARCCTLDIGPFIL